MGATTQCPACHTVFRVLDEQLRVSSGWVRCGQCHEVFDAQPSLALEGDPQPAALPVEAQQLEATAEQPSSGATAATLHADESEAKDLVAAIQQEQVSAEHQAVSDATSTVESSAAPLEPTAEVSYAAQIEEIARDATNAGPKAPIGAFLQASIDPPLDAAPVSAQPADSSDAAAGVSFMKSNKASRASRWAWAGFAALLALCAAAQVLWFWRDEIAARWPISQAWLETGCAHLRCDVQAPRRPEAISVESASVSALAASSAYRVNLLIKSRASTLVAAPAVELTLKDSSENTLFKRVLSPQELKLPAQGLPPNSEHATTLVVSTSDGNTPAKKVAGYSALPFYP
jgi:predicted Zn finger-like uncharacterized protein